MRTIAIVGAGTQLGEAIGKRFAREGFAVALIARNREKLEATAARLAEHETPVGVFPADITDRSALIQALKEAEETLGPIEVLEYSPAPSPADIGRAPFVEAREVSVESILPQLDLYLFGGVTAVQQVLPGMLERGSGTVLVTSGAGSGPVVVPQIANQTIAAAAMRNWMLTLNASLAGTGVYAAHVAILAFIGQGRPDSEPDRIADLYWQLHTTRDQAELFHQDMPEMGPGEFRLADRFTDEDSPR
jgi:short-subunit dehydrogenase